MTKTAGLKWHSRQNVHSHCRYCLHYTDNENINVDYNVRYYFVVLADKIMNVSPAA